MKHRRRGISLVEVLVVISLTGIMVSATGVCLHGLYQVEQEVREATVRRSAIDRLASRFRIDAHSATEVRLQTGDAEADAKIEFACSDGRTINYKQQDKQVVRTVRQEDEVLHTDSFRLGRKYNATWTVDPGPPSIATVDVTRHLRGETQARGQHCQRIAAVVGLHGNLSGGGL